MQNPEKDSLSIKQRGGRRPGAGRKPGIPNKLTAPMKVLASQYGPDALETLVQIMRGSQNEQVRIAAAKELLDRGFGRPAQAVEVSRGRDLTVIVNRTGDRVPSVGENPSTE